MIGMASQKLSGALPSPPTLQIGFSLDYVKFNGSVVANDTADFIAAGDWFLSAA